MNLSACSALRTSPLTGVWYRALPLAHLRTALQTSQTRVIPGRFNSGSGLFDVLYLCENQFVAFMEVGATFGSLTTVIPNPAVAWAALNVRVTLNAVADLTVNLTMLQTNAQELTGDWRGYSDRKTAGSMIGIEVGQPPTHQIGDALYATPSLEGFVTFSAKMPTYRCLVVFPNKLHSRSAVEFFDPSGNLIHRIP
jgi:RES domain-containing protein